MTAPSVHAGHHPQGPTHHHPHAAAPALAQVRAGYDARVLFVEGGERVQQRLAGLGIMKGARLHVKRNDLSGPVVVALAHGRIALGRGMSGRVRVALAPAPPRDGAP